jgi:hypothetical protein
MSQYPEALSNHSADLTIRERPVFTGPDKAQTLQSEGQREHVYGNGDNTEGLVSLCWQMGGDGSVWYGADRWTKVTETPPLFGRADYCGNELTSLSETNIMN